MLLHKHAAEPPAYLAAIARPTQNVNRAGANTWSAFVDHLAQSTVKFDENLASVQNHDEAPR